MRGRFIDPGMLRVPLELENVVQTATDSGGLEEIWQEVATVMAHIEPAAGQHLFGADRHLERASHRITIRHRPDVASGQRFARGVRRFLILTASDPDETGRYLVCRTREEKG